MAIAEYDVVIHRDAMSVYDFLLDPRNLPSWRDGVRSMELESGAAGTKGAVYRQTHRRAQADDPWPRTSKSPRRGPGRRSSTRSLAGPERTHGGYYLSTEGGSTRVRFALNCEPRGFLARLNSPFRRRMKAEVVPARAAQVAPRRSARSGIDSPVQ